MLFAETRKQFVALSPPPRTRRGSRYGQSTWSSSSELNFVALSSESTMSLTLTFCSSVTWPSRDGSHLSSTALGTKRSSAQITNYSREELEGRRIVGVVNFPPRQIGPVRSEVLVLGASDEEGRVILLAPDTDVPLGARIH